VAKIVTGGEHGVDGIAGSMAVRRLNSRLICGVTRRFWPLV
jgi:hypothetical protein